MGGTASKGRREVLNEINVTPLVDVMLVLLIIFMVTAPMMQQGIDVELPETTSTGIETKEDPFVLKIRKNGEVFVGSEPIPMNRLKRKIRAIFENRKDKQVYIHADKRVRYEFVAKTMAEVRAAGILSIGLVTLPLKGF